MSDLTLAERIELKRLRDEVEGTNHLSGNPLHWGLRSRLEGVCGQRDDAYARIAQLLAALKAQEELENAKQARTTDDYLALSTRAKRLRDDALAVSMEEATWISPEEYKKGLEDEHNLATQNERDGWTQGLRACGIQVETASDHGIKQAVANYDAAKKAGS